MANFEVETFEKTLIISNVNTSLIKQCDIKNINIRRSQKNNIGKIDTNENFKVQSILYKGNL